MTTDITFYSAWYCPFAQRTWAALEHLDIPYQYDEIDPYIKSESWMKISRGTGQVPVLQTKSGLSIPDSMRSFDYLDQGHVLFPEPQDSRAEARFWLDYQGANIIPYFYRFLKAEKNSAMAEIAKRQMLAGLIEFTAAMSPNGPYFFGDTPNAVDFAFAPFALRIELLLDVYKDYQLPRYGENWQRYHVWWNAMETQPAFLRTMPEPETYTAKLADFYLPYSKGGGQTDVTQ
jgi:glutathione S-transferase